MIDLFLLNATDWGEGVSVSLFRAGWHRGAGMLPWRCDAAVALALVILFPMPRMLPLCEAGAQPKPAVE